MIKTIYSTILLICGCALLSSCAYSGIKPIGKDTYMSARTKSGYSSGGEALADLYEEAYPFCEQQGLKFVPVHETSKDGVPGFALASATIQFRCVAESDQEALKRPTMHQEPNIVIQNK